MGNLNQIKSKLSEMEGGAFQRLCDDWLHRKGFKNITPIGMMAKTNRVAKGTPDSLVIAPNEKYVFCEYTVQQKRLAEKLEKDIYKCLDENKVGISIEKIGVIIICYLGKLETHEIDRLRDICWDRKVLLELYGLDSIALSIQNFYPVLSEKYLELPLDTGQLLPVDDFVISYGKNRLTTSIDNDILFQEEALKSAVSTLTSANFLLVSGAAGVGKTLFSVNLARELQLQSENLKVYCLFDKGADLIRDITAYFSEPGDYLIFIDDANRLDNRLDYLLHYLHENDGNRKFRIIATVRDYARKEVIEKVERFTEIHEQYIKPLLGNQIKELTETLFGIKNGEYQNRIQEIVCGNARLAVMASKIATETNQIESIQNMTSLYDDYFGQNDNVKEVVEDRKLMAAACAICFFRKINKLNESQMKQVQDSFGIQVEEFWELVHVLHKKELVDLYEDEVVKMSDQILSTYLFYVSVFEKKIIPFSVIVKNFYPDRTKTIVDSLNPVINSFDHKRIASVIRNEVKDIFDEISQCGDIEKSIEFLSTFWFSLPTESLTFANKFISEMPAVNINWENENFEQSQNEPYKSSLVKLLGNFRYYKKQEFEMSFDLLLNYLEKDKDSLRWVIHNLLGRYNYKLNDWKYGYDIQSYIIDKLVERMDEGKNYLFTRLFISIVNAFLKVEHTEGQWSGDNMKLIKFRLLLNSDQLSIREKIIKNISILVKDDSYKNYSLDQFKEYIDHLRYEGEEMAKADMPFFRDYFVINLDPDNISHCIIMENYIEHLDFLGLETPAVWKEEFSNDTLTLSNLLLEDGPNKRMLDMDYNEYNQYRYEGLVEYFTGITDEKFNDFIKHCIILNQELSGRDRDYLLKNGIIMSFSVLAEIAPDAFLDCVSIYQEYDEILGIHPRSIISDLFNLTSSEEVWEIINAKDYKSKKLWLSMYFALLPEEAVTQEQVISLINHVSNTPSNELAGWLDFLDKYQNIDSEIYSKVVRILVDKSKDDPNCARPLYYLFNNHSEIFGNWFEVFKSDETLVFDAYLAAFKVEQHMDYTGETLKLLTERTPEFLFRVIDQIYEKEKWLSLSTTMPELSFLWERESYLEDIEDYGKYLLNKDENLFLLGDSVFCKLFTEKSGKIKSEELTNRRHKFFRNIIENNADNIKYINFMLQAAQYMGEDFRRELLVLFIACNTNFNDFQNLNYGQVAKSWWGSYVPILEREKKFLESLLPIFNTIDLLEHKNYVEKQVGGKIKQMEEEKKKDFLEDR